MLPGAVAALLNRGPFASDGAVAGRGYRVYFPFVRRGRSGGAHFRGFARIRIGCRRVLARCNAQWINSPTPRYVRKQNIRPLLLTAHLPHGRSEFWV